MKAEIFESYGFLSVFDIFYENISVVLLTDYINAMLYSLDRYYLKRNTWSRKIIHCKTHQGIYSFLLNTNTLFFGKRPIGFGVFKNSSKMQYFLFK